MKQDKNEIRWDKLLHIQTMGRDDSNSDQYRDIRMSQHRILYWNVWQIQDISGKIIHCLIMDVGRDG